MSLRELLAQDRVLMAPGVFDALSAILVERAGFPLAFLSGAALSFTRFGLPDMGFTTLTQLLDAVEPNLPDDIEDPLILRYDPTLDPVLTISILGEGPEFAGERGLKRLRRLADRDLRRGLEPLPGVAAIKVKGGLEEEIEVDLDEAQLRRMRLGVADVVARLEAENVDLAGGTLQDGPARFLVRTVNEFRDVDDIGDVVVTRVGEREVRLRDVATIRAGYKDREVITRVDGAESVEIEVYKEADANIVDMADRVRAYLDDVAIPELRAQHGATLRISSDRSRFIESSLREVQQTALGGGALAVLVLLLFLRDVRSTVIVAVSIPVSVLMTFAPLQFAGVSLNIMSLGGLALGIGMLVDNSIVVLESIYRCREDGDDLVTATLRGTSEVGGAVVASTLTTVAVFFPMVFVEGVAGQMFGDLGLAVVCSLLASLVVALFLIPMLASRGAGTATAVAPVSEPFGRAWRDHWRRWSAWVELVASVHAMRERPWRVLFVPYVVLRFLVHALFELTAKLLASLALLCGLAWFGVGVGLRRTSGSLLGRAVAALGAAGARAGRIYPAVLGVALRRAWAVLGAALLAFAGLAWGVARLDTELIPELHQGEFTAEVAFPVGTPLRVTDARVAPIERAALADVPHRDTLTTTVGSEPEAADATTQGQHTARLRVTLAPDAIARRSAEVVEREAIAGLRDLLGGQPDIHVDIQRPVLFSFKAPIEVEIRGHELDELARVTHEVRKQLQAIAGLREVQSSIRPGSPELHIHYDRDALARYGLDLRTVAELVRDKVQGTEATQFNRRDRKVPIRVRLADIEEASLAELRALVVNPGGAQPLPLGAVAEIEPGRGPNEIRRIGQQRVGLVTANLDDVSLGEAVRAIEAALARIPLGEGMRATITGQSAEWDRSAQSLLLALGLSIFLVYVIMAAQFESLVYPFIILFSIPLAAIGVALALWLLDIPISVLVLLGTILLAGIVVNNAIVLVDYVGRLKARGMATEAALVEAGRVRLRPILMTSVTTVLGLLPMALGLGDGAEVRRPMAITVIAGLSISTVLTLVVIPVLYALVDRWRGATTSPSSRECLAAELAMLDPRHLAPETPDERRP